MSEVKKCSIDLLPFQIDPITAMAIGRDAIECLWKPIHKPIYNSLTNPPQFSDMEVGDTFVCPDVLPTTDIVKNVFVVVESLGCYRSLGSQNLAELLAPFKANDYIYVTEPWMIATDNDAYPGSVRYQWTGSRRTDTGVWMYGVEERPTELLKWQNPLRMPAKYSRQLYNIASVEIVRVSAATDELAASLGFLPSKRCCPAEAFASAYRDRCWIKGSRSNQYLDWAWIFKVTKVS